MSTLFTIAQQRRNAGTYYLPGPSGATLPAGTTEIIATAVMDATDIADSTLQIAYALEQLLGGQWVTLIAQTWQGGFTDRTGAAIVPTLDYTSTGAWPPNVRLTVTLPRRLNIGATVTVLP
jgi:hypothetical protein